MPLESWRRSSFSSSGADCVELAKAGVVRDSKNPTGATIRVDLGALVKAVKTDRLAR